MSTTRLTTTDGVTFITKSNDFYISKSLEVYGEWSFGEIGILSKILSKSDNIVEAGANIGAHTVFLAKGIVPDGKVFAFEPRRILFQTLCGNLAVNGIENVHAFHCGLGEEAVNQTEAKMDFSSQLNAGGCSLGAIPGNDENIKIEKLDDILNDTDRIALIKADVEGYELKLLMGAVNLIERDRPFLYLENDKVESSLELISYLWGLKYDVWWHIVPLFNPKNRANTEQNIFPGSASFNIICAPREKGFSITGESKIEDANAHPLKGT
jgi:FkbM family methyltransferase